jgi:hypothetical protein
MKRLHDTGGEVAALTRTKVAGNNKFWNWLNQVCRMFSSQEKAWVFLELLQEPGLDATEPLLWREWLKHFQAVSA